MIVWRMKFFDLKILTIWLERTARVILGAVFIYASWSKILHPAGFAESIANYQILPPMWVNPTALLLPWLELMCGVGVLSGVLTRGNALIAAILLLVFGAVLGYSAYRGLDIHCGCFSVGGEAASNLYLDLLRDIVLLITAILIMIFYGRPRRSKAEST